MLQRALINFDKTVFLRKNCYRNGSIMWIVVHETRRKKQIWIDGKQYFIIYPSFIPSVTNEWSKLPRILLRENVTKAMLCNMNIRLILPCCINDCECVSNTIDLFCLNLGDTSISYLNFSNWIYCFIFDSFDILQM